ncbi:breast carcinoma-amplified sequence 4 isoform X2 [Cervus canadensis]|uniref:breast carcinoma-amplified sequence 4 isoform X2 n=1 Tax=Cervus canadensis TaxID=1574408 RepID=UPI001C9E4B37|nr:breast carcinoma-amplified sequence 4 isoform X2 [Cervus canadensis]
MLLLDADRPEPVRGGARELAVFLTPEPGAEAKEVEETIEGLLLRLEEFCSLADMAFVKMVRRHVSFLEAHVLQAERDHGALSQTLRKWLGSSGLPALGNVSIPTSPPRPRPRSRERGTGNGSSKGTAGFCRQEAASGWLVGGWPGGWGIADPLLGAPVCPERRCRGCPPPHPQFSQCLLFA